MRDRPGVAFLDALLAQDFVALNQSLADDVHLRALLPGGLREWSGAEDVAARFEHWFGHTERFEVAGSHDAAIADRAHLVWQLRLQAERLGPGWFVVEQAAYAAFDEHDRIARLDLVCTGYLPELEPADA